MISVIVAVYNSEKYLKKSIDALLNQSYSDYEIILVDDGSTDASASICDAYAEKHPNLQVIHVKHQGASGARNVGLDSAKGDLVMFCDSDDIVEPDWISKLSACMNDTNVVMSVCSFYLQKSNNSRKPVSQPCGDAVFDVSELLARFKEFNLNTIWHCCYRKTDCRFHEDLALGEDHIFNLEYILNNSDENHSKICYINECLYNHVYDIKDSLSKKNVQRDSFYDYLSDCYVEFFTRFNYSSSEKNRIINEFENDKFGSKISYLIRAERYDELKKLSADPMWIKYADSHKNSRYRWLLKRKNVFLIRLVYRLYMPVHLRFKT